MSNLTFRDNDQTRDVGPENPLPVDLSDEPAREVGLVAPRSRAVAAADHDTDVANALVSIALASGDIVHGVAWSYSAAPTGGRLRILEGAVVVFDVDITAAGPGYIPFSRPKRLAAAGTIELAAAGAGVIGKVNLL